MNLLIKYPSRSRPDKFRAALKNIYNTIQTENYSILVTVDSDDETMLPLVNEPFPHVTFKVIPPVSKIYAVNAEMPLDGWDWCVLMSDDMRFIKTGWDQVMVRNIKNTWGDSLDFFYHCDDGYQGHKLATMSIFGREYYERFFFIYAPCYRSLSCDAEAMYTAMLLKRYKYFPEKLVAHEHPANNKCKSDSLYVRNDKFAKQDAEVYFKRLNKDFYVNNAGPTPFDKWKRK